MTNLESKVISCMRFPMIVGVVLIHCNFSHTIKNGWAEYVYFYNVQSFISEYLARIAVPLFFFISGFCFFNNIKDFTISVYKSKLLKRRKSLLYPYLIWNLITALIFYLGQTLFPTMMSGSQKNLSDMSILEWFSIFWNYIGNKFPIDGPLWFVRDLIVICSLSPVIYKCCKNTILGWLYISILFVLWFGGFQMPIEGIGFPCLLFFSLGSMFAIHSFTIFIKSGSLSILVSILYILLGVLFLVSRDSCVKEQFLNSGIILGMIVSFQFAKKLCENMDFSPNKFLSNSSFFIFASHSTLLMVIYKVLLKVFTKYSDMTLLFIYFTSAILCILLCLGTYYLLSKYLPRFSMWLCGGRN